MNGQHASNPAGRLEVPSAVLAGIEQAARAAWPEECCGLFLGTLEDAEEGRGGRVWRVSRAVASPNVAPGPSDRFEIAPQVHLAALRAARAEGLAVIGHYHSHPGAAALAEPSPTDRASAFYPDHAWLILALPGPDAPATPAAWTPGPAAEDGLPDFLPLALRKV